MQTRLWDSYSEAVKNECWRRGYLFGKLYDYQFPIYADLWEVICSPNHKLGIYSLLCARRFGKTTIMSLIAIEFAIRNPDSQIRYACPTSKGLRKILLPIFKMFLRDCPEDLRPQWKTQDSEWVFPNGSVITCAGTNKENAESLRGQNSHLNLITEAGFIDDLQYVVKSILSPQTLTTGGKTLIESTPPEEGMAHEFYDIFMECESKEATKIRTIYDIEPKPKGMLEKAIEDSGGIHTDHFKREYECKWITNQEMLVIPEWSTEYEREVPLDQYRQFYHNYSVMDLTGGANDKQAHLYGYYDFSKAALVITHESTLLPHEVDTEIIAHEVKSKELEAFNEFSIYQRWSDNNNLIMLRDLGKFHGLHFSPTSKDSLQAMVNEVRLWVKAGRVLIHPRCIQTIGCVKYGIWDKHHKEFKRTKAYGHFDHLAALVYFIRNVNHYTNPIPYDYGKTVNTRMIGQTEKATNKALKEIFGVK